MSNKTMTFTNSKTETFFERHAWKVLLFFSVFMALIGMPDMLVGGSFYQEVEGTTLGATTGMTWEQLEAASPNAAAMIDLKLRIGGIQFLFLGLFSMAVTLTGFRRGEKWAWYTLWLYPLFLGLHTLVILSAYKHPQAGIPVPLVL